MYARTDARLALEIGEKLNLIALAVARSKLTGMTPDRVAASIASFDFLYLAELNKRRIVAPSVRSDDARVFAAQAGGHVLEPRPGVHDNVWVFDFKSLYPSLIRTFNIDPLALVTDAAAVPDPIETAGGARFRREPAILPQLLDDLFPRREAAKRNGDAIASHAIKILMNSFYGVLGTPACRFYNPELANAITGQGKHFLLWSKDWFEKAGYTVLYGDTDSLFVQTRTVDAAEAAAEGKALAVRLNRDVSQYIVERWRVKSHLELEFEKLYVEAVPGLGAARVRRRAQTLCRRHPRRGSGERRVRRNGSGAPRLDRTREAGTARTLSATVHRPAGRSYLTDVVGQVRRGELDHALVYRKGLRKGVGEYTASTPPHVAAARKSTR